MALPETALNLDELEALARARLEPQAYDYFASGADDQLTVAENRRAFARWQLRPRVLVDVDRRELGCEVLGERLAAPILLAPAAFQALAHPEAELASARAAAAFGTIFTLSTLASRSLTEVAATGPGQRWFQLYCARERRISETLVRRAEDLGYRALCLTVDVPLVGRREPDLRNRFSLPPEAAPCNLLEFVDRSQLGSGNAGSALAALVNQLIDPSLCWRDLEWLRSLSSLKLVLKGILTAEDARLALEHGVDAVVVSNHGGRQLDGAPAALDALEEIHAEVGGRLPLLVDGGIRRGTDVAKALALGAEAVLIGRPYLWGLAVAGQDGVEAVLASLAEELSSTLALLGCTHPGQLGRQHLRRAG